MDLTRNLFNETGSRNGPDSPLYHGTREMLGLYDLVVSFKTKRCPFSCNFCSLPEMSEEADVSQQQLVEQIDRLFDIYAGELTGLERVTVRNEGSVLDPTRFFPGALDHLIAKLGNLPKLKLLSLETRLEYAAGMRLQEIAEKLGPDRKLDLTVGFETQDEYIINEVLGKRLNKKRFEEKVGLLGKYSVGLTAYVMLKPGPKMTEQEGIDEALKSVDYLHSLGQKTGTRITVYVNPTYAAEGSRLVIEMKEKGYEPPTRESLDLVMAESRKKGIAVYTD